MPLLNESIGLSSLNNYFGHTETIGISYKVNESDNPNLNKSFDPLSWLKGSFVSSWLNESFDPPRPNESMDPYPLNESFHLSRLNESLGLSGLNESFGLSRLNESLGLSGLNESFWLSRLNESLGLSGLNESFGLSRLNESLGLSGLNESFGLSRLNESLGLSGLNESFGLSRLRRYNYEDDHEWPDDDNMDYDFDENGKEGQDLTLMEQIGMNWQKVGVRLVYVFAGGCFLLMLTICCGKMLCQLMLYNLKGCPCHGCMALLASLYEDPLYTKAKEISEMFGLKLDYATFLKLKEKAEEAAQGSDMMGFM